VQLLWLTRYAILTLFPFQSKRSGFGEERPDASSITAPFAKISPVVITALLGAI